MTSKKALIIIDYTNDFVAEKGALSCGEPAQKIENAIVSLMQEFLDNKDYIVLATDNHQSCDPYHPESRLFPPHNINGTDGRSFYGALADLVLKNPECYKMDKRRYSSFAGTDLDIRLRERGITELHLCGVCTDICVLHTAIEAYNLGYAIVIHEKACASFNHDGHKFALAHFKSTLGASVV